MAKPTTVPRWAETLEVDPLTGAENKVEPTEEFKLSGLKRKELLARAFLNWQFDSISKWITYLGNKTTVYDLTGGTDIDPDNGGKQTLILSGNTTLTESMVSGDEVELYITASGFTLTFPASVDWGDVGAPTLATEDVVKLRKVGTTVYATRDWSNT